MRARTFVHTIEQSNVFSSRDFNFVIVTNNLTRNTMVASHACGVCGTEAALVCGGCSSVFYCGKEHQKQHWGSHRKECLPYKVVASPEAGK